ncbi:MAG TPA: EAL domain-containing protein [Nocardioides sp.]|nr:EAL domain-containing protein [Nocardioides sp.]
MPCGSSSTMTRGTGRTAAWSMLAAGAALMLSVAVVRDATYSGAVIGLSSLVAIVAIGVGMARHRPVNRTFWQLNVVAISTALVAGALTAALPASPTAGVVVDLVYVAGYTVFVLAALWVLPARGEQRDWLSLLDSLTVALALAVAFWSFAVSPALSSQLTLHTVVTAVVWPVYDITLVMVLSRLLMSGVRRDFPLAMVALALASSIVVDFWYAATATSGGYVWGQVSDALWVVPMTCMGAAALHPAMRDFVSVEDGVRLRITWGRTFGVGLGTFAVPLGIGLLALERGRLEQTAPVLLVFVALLVVANTARAAEMVRHTRKLADDVMDLNEQLTETLRERDRLNEELHHRSVHDGLTGLANRELLRSRIEAMLRDRRRSRAALLFIDLDDFKSLNDTLGHSAGDAALTEVARRISGLVRDQDLVARLGGDEFAVLLSDVDRAVVNGLAERLVAALAEPVDVGATTTRLGASVGIAWVGDARTADDLIRDADIAMYRAKAEGKNRVSVFAAEMHERLLARARAKDALSQALEAGEVDVAYQPVVHLEDGRVDGVEGLVRWTPPGGTPVSAVELVRLAEETGLIATLGRYVLARAAEQVSAWRAQGVRLNLAVNVSSQQLGDPEFGPAVLAALEHFDADQALVLEITESSIVLGQGPEIALLEHLRARGCRIAVDDFGTGFSSLAYLKRLPIDIVKMDKLFVAGVDSGPEEASVARAIVSMSHALGYTVVAEGIERESEARALLDLGCRLGQGYLFARPLPADEVTALVLGGPAGTGTSGGGPVHHVGVRRLVGEAEA